ncbi:MAG: AAA family ATPase [Desulfobacterales bacterium]|nr:AAA family ATPase [Desulfobacterales bacterium]
MRKFSSYGPVNTKLHYYVPRKELINRAHAQLVGEIPDEGGHYITIWAPRQAGKTWVMQHVLWRLQKDERFDVLKINLEHLKMNKDADAVLRSVTREILKGLKKEIPDKDIIADSAEQLQSIFGKNFLTRPLVLILDEFDALDEDAISLIVGVFRNIYTIRQDQSDRITSERDYLLHGVALIGVRSVLGIENQSGSPFNVQRSVHIPNLTFDEAKGLFDWYEKESGQKIEHDVVERLFYETWGQPGLTCWFGELLTETYNQEKGRPINMSDFDYAFMMAVQALPNANVINIISTAKKEPHKDVVLELFKTDRKMVFKYDNPSLNYIYMNGVTDIEMASGNLFVRFSCPFVQKRLFNYFSDELFSYTGKLCEPFENMDDIFVGQGLNIRNLMRRFQTYLKKNREWLLEDAPKRKDMRIFEAVYHFNLYRYLCDFLETRHAKVWPEFPTGNGAIDIIIKFADCICAIEVKSYTDQVGYNEALNQSARYGKQLKLSEISLVFFVEYIDDANREKYEKDYTDEETGVRVMPVFVETGN